jgi:formylglycine-generating enzyme required for sulfatase activity
MLGNVWEWVNDWHSGTYYSDPAAGNNPTGPATGYYKVRRGGDFASTGFYLRDSFRGFYPPDYFDRFGFRCAR